MASALRCSLARPATTRTPQLIQHTNPLFSQLTLSPSASVIPATRLFSTSPLLLRAGLPNQGTPRNADGTESDLPIPTMSSRDPRIPVYPYGERQSYKQSNRGLYGEARIRFGNSISKKHDVKTNRKWKPNVRRRRLWSEGLRCMVQTRVTSRVMRTIDKVGGLDNYLLGEKPARQKELGPWGWKLRWRLMQTDVIRDRFREQRIALGLEFPSYEDTIRDEQMYAAASEGGLVTAMADSAEVDRMLLAEEEFAIGKDDA